MWSSEEIATCRQFCRRRIELCRNSVILKIYSTFVYRDFQMSIRCMRNSKPRLWQIAYGSKCNAFLSRAFGIRNKMSNKNAHTQKHTHSVFILLSCMGQKMRLFGRYLWGYSIPPQCFLRPHYPVLFQFSFQKLIRQFSQRYSSIPIHC